MEFFRRNIVRRAFTLFTGLVFLNLSFLLTEINSLSIKSKNTQLFENLVKMVRGLEEENEKTGELAGEKKEAREVDFYVTGLIASSHPYYKLLTPTFARLHSNVPLNGVSSVVIQPPEA